MSSTSVVNVRAFPLVDGKRVLPSDVVYIGRKVQRVGLAGSLWANPYRAGQTVEDSFGTYVLLEPRVIGMYRTWLEERLAEDPYFIEWLRGKRLACWCAPRSCHGDVIVDALELHRPLPRPGERLEFGRHAMPVAEAEAAPAWPSLAAFEGRRTAAYRRQLNKAAVSHPVSHQSAGAADYSGPERPAGGNE